MHFSFQLRNCPALTRKHNKNGGLSVSVQFAEREVLEKIQNSGFTATHYTSFASCSERKMAFAAVAPEPAAVAIVGETGLDTSPTA